MSNDAAPLLRNRAKEKLANGQPVYSMTVRLVRSIDIASIAHTAGFDSVYIDLEHSGFSLDALSQVCMAWTNMRRERGNVAAQLARMRSSFSSGFS